MGYYDEIAPGYDALHGQEQRKKIGLVAQQISVKKEDLVLDVGCGTGIAAAFFSKIMGVDPAIEMLKQARMPVVCAKGERLPFQDEVFDGILCMTAVHHMDVPQALQEMRRVVKKEGWVAVSVLKKARDCENIMNEIAKVFSCERIDVGRDVLLYGSAVKV